MVIQGSRLGQFKAPKVNQGSRLEARGSRFNESVQGSR